VAADQEYRAAANESEARARKVAEEEEAAAADADADVFEIFLVEALPGDNGSDGEEGGEVLAADLNSTVRAASLEAGAAAEEPKNIPRSKRLKAQQVPNVSFFLFRIEGLKVFFVVAMGLLLWDGQV
jgi:hypothetical protein